MQHSMPDTFGEKRRGAAVRGRQKPFPLRQAQIKAFLDQCQDNGRTESTLRKYRSDLARFQDSLGPEQMVYADSMARWRQSMITAGYAPRSINASLVAVNCLFDYLGCWEWKCSDWMELPELDGPELSREDYLALLNQARRDEDVRLYLLVKIMGTTPLTPSDLPLVTREAVNAGIITGKKRGGEGDIVIHPALREDLLEFAIQHGVRTGPVFLSSNRRPLERTMVSKLVALLGEAVGLEPGAANPRNLRRLYLSTMAEFQRCADVWVAQSYATLLAEEEATVAWRQRE